jgi:large subunit ribosomal protein L39
MLWDMHNPLEDSCTIQLLNFKIQDPSAVNRAFWRSCSFMMGAVLHRVLKEDTGLFLHSFPKPNIRSGSFIHDFALNEKGWNPNVRELKTISIEMQKFASENHAFERLKVNHDLAFEMFKDNPYKREQLPSISNSQDGNVILYRAGDHIDISGGPMIANSNFLHRLNIASVHKISKADDTSSLYRIQGIGLPHNFRISEYAFKILIERARKLVSVL